MKNRVREKGNCRGSLAAVPAVASGLRLASNVMTSIPHFGSGRKRLLALTSAFCTQNRRRCVLVLAAVVLLGGAALAWRLWPRPVTGGDWCGPCPGTLPGGWSLVRQYPGDVALVECQADRLPVMSGQPDIAPWPPAGGLVWDGRGQCPDGSLAAGEWYHHAYARPVIFLDPSDRSQWRCTWQLGGAEYWTFVENDACPPYGVPGLPYGEFLQER